MMCFSADLMIKSLPQFFWNQESYLHCISRTLGIPSNDNACIKQLHSKYWSLTKKKAKPCIEFVSDGAERMKELISVLAFSRVVRIESETATMDLNKVKTYYEL